ncbi:MAG: I78 family peptidase inhibitor [Marivita lacus]|nr:I78 family peptidase inhibitor [Marivita lacus]
MRIYSILGLCLGLAACQEVTVEERPAESCGAEEMSHLMGLQRAQLENIAFSQPHRILGPDDAATMDFRGERVNFLLDDSGTVVRIYCG